MTNTEWELIQAYCKILDRLNGIGEPEEEEDAN